MDEGVDSRRVGLLSTGAPARQHSKIFTEDGEEVKRRRVIFKRHNLQDHKVAATANLLTLSNSTSRKTLWDFCRPIFGSECKKLRTHLAAVSHKLCHNWIQQTSRTLDTVIGCGRLER